MGVQPDLSSPPSAKHSVHQPATQPVVSGGAQPEKPPQGPARELSLSPGGLPELPPPSQPADVAPPWASLHQEPSFAVAAVDSIPLPPPRAPLRQEPTCAVADVDSIALPPPKAPPPGANLCSGRRRLDPAATAAAIYRRAAGATARTQRRSAASKWRQAGRHCGAQLALYIQGTSAGAHLRSHRS